MKKIKNNLRVIGTVVMVVAFISSISAKAATTSGCNVELKVKQYTTTAPKNAKLDGVSFSAKQIEALKTVCNVTLKQMSVDEAVEDFRKGLEKKLAKLEAKAVTK